jgi:hypothetical protein
MPCQGMSGDLSLVPAHPGALSPGQDYPCMYFVVHALIFR